jgi:hypothetical protein
MPEATARQAANSLALRQSKPPDVRRANHNRLAWRVNISGRPQLSTQDRIIERLGLADYMDRGKISDFEREVREPDLLTLKAYANEAGVTVDDLIDDNVSLP